MLTTKIEKTNEEILDRPTVVIKIFKASKDIIKNEGKMTNVMYNTVGL